MEPSSLVRSWAAVLGLVLAAACGGLTGFALADRANTPHTETLTLDDPAGAVDTREPLRSSGGFTGFEGLALAGPVQRTGEVTATDGGTFSVVNGASTLDVSMTSTARLYHIIPASSPLQPGDVVVVSLDDDGNPTAVLRVPGDLRED